VVIENEDDMIYQKDIRGTYVQELHPKSKKWNEYEENN